MNLHVFSRSWVEYFAAAMLWLTTLVDWTYGAWGPAVITAGCAGIVSGIAFARWARDRSR